MHSRRFAPFALTLLLVGLSAACGGGSTDPASQGSEALLAPVTGTAVPPTDRGEQSETVSAVVNTDDFRQVLVSYNDMTGEVDDGYIYYDAANRRIFHGASLAGWSISGDDGAHFDYGGKVRPPSGWAVLWGDPSITVSRVAQQYVYITELAVPDSKFPLSGSIDGPITDNSPSGSFLGGACILRSTDFGKSFTVSPNDCVSDGDDFYDGSSIVTDNDGAVYAAFNDVTRKTIEVWRAPSPTAPFVRLVNPFTNLGPIIESHPRLRYDVVSNRVYVLAQDLTGIAENPLLNGFAIDFKKDQIGELLMDYLENGSWHGGNVVAVDAVLNPIIPINVNDPFGFLRSGPQFSFDVGNSSVNGDDAIRVSYTASRSDGTRKIKTARCTRDLSCLPSPEWSTAPLSGNQWGPDVRTQLGFIGIVPVWKLSYTSTTNETGLGVGWRQGTLAVVGTGSRVFVEFSLGTGHALCADLRGYWGDYDSMDILSTSTTQTVFFRARSNSDATCSHRWQFTEDPLHVDGISF